MSPTRDDDDDAEHIMAREFAAAIDNLTDRMTEGFNSVNVRMESQNRAINHLTERVATNAAKTETLEKTVHASTERELRRVAVAQRHVHARKDDRKTSADDIPLTLRDLKRVATIIGAVVGGVVTFLGIVSKYGPVIAKWIVGAANGPSLP